MLKNWPRSKLIKFSIITILLVLIVLEIIFRIIFAIEYRGYNTSVYVQGNTLQVSDSLLVFHNRPFYVQHFKQYQFNQEGMRANTRDVFMPAKQPGDFWVFLFGGSAMEGMGSNRDGEWLDITGADDYRQEETIAGHLQSLLQKEMPGRKVRVFNAANSGFTILQSRLRYEHLSEKYQMDWVISMDGENEPPVLEQEETVRTYVKKRWNNSPVFQFPLNVVVPVTSRSAFINKMKQGLFALKYHHRLNRNEEDAYPARKRWSEQAHIPLRFAAPHVASEKAIRAYFDELKRFDSLLQARTQRHRLFIQPHLAFRDTSVMNITERALLNYYSSTYNDPFNNSFKKRILTGKDSLPGHVMRMTELQTMDQPVFVDYCHFTPEANKMIAFMIAWEILKEEAENN